MGEGTEMKNGLNMCSLHVTLHKECKHYVSKHYKKQRDPRNGWRKEGVKRSGLRKGIKMYVVYVLIPHKQCKHYVL